MVSTPKTVTRKLSASSAQKPTGKVNHRKLRLGEGETNSLVSAICTPQRVTRFSLRNGLMVPPAAPTPLRQRQTTGKRRTEIQANEETIESNEIETTMGNNRSVRFRSDEDVTDFASPILSAKKNIQYKKVVKLTPGKFVLGTSYVEDSDDASVSSPMPSTKKSAKLQKADVSTAGKFVLADSSGDDASTDEANEANCSNYSAFDGLPTLFSSSKKISKRKSKATSTPGKFVSVKTPTDDDENGTLDKSVAERSTKFNMRSSKRLSKKSLQQANYDESITGKGQIPTQNGENETASETGPLKNGNVEENEEYQPDADIAAEEESMSPPGRFVKLDSRSSMRFTNNFVQLENGLASASPSPSKKGQPNVAENHPTNGPDCSISNESNGQIQDGQITEDEDGSSDEALPTDNTAVENPIDSNPVQQNGGDVSLTEDEDVDDADKTRPIVENAQNTTNKSIIEKHESLIIVDETAAENNGETTLNNTFETKPTLPNIVNMSVVDLTDSPMVTNRSKETDVLNLTFSPSPNSNKSTINDRTFSPIESSHTNKAQKKEALMTAEKVQRESPRLRRIEPSKTSDDSPFAKKKMSPTLKRLQNSPFQRQVVRNNVATPGKISSAKKIKLQEAAEAIVAENVKTPKPRRVAFDNTTKNAASTPKTLKKTPAKGVFKFGAKENDDPIVARPFNFQSITLKPMKAMEKTGNKEKKANTSSSVVKQVPNFKRIHERAFENSESIDETSKRVEQRAVFLFSGKKTDNTKSPIPAPTRGKSRRKLDLNGGKTKMVMDKPLPALEPARPVLKPKNTSTKTKDGRIGKLLAERHEWRKNQFKRRSGTHPTVKENKRTEIKGVRLNRRFDLLMAKRLKESK